MAFKFYNPNPKNKLVIDCTVRAISKFLNMDWDSCYVALSVKGFEMKNMQNSNEVWHAYLRDLGYYPTAIRTCSMFQRRYRMRRIHGRITILR